MTPYYLIACAFLDKVIPTCFFLLTAPSARTELPRSGSSRPPDRDADEGRLGGRHQSRWGPSLGLRGANHQRQIVRQGGRSGNRIVVQVGFHFILQRRVNCLLVWFHFTSFPQVTSNKMENKSPPFSSQTSFYTRYVVWFVLPCQTSKWLTTQTVVTRATPKN